MTVSYYHFYFLLNSQTNHLLLFDNKKYNSLLQYGNLMLLYGYMQDLTIMDEAG